MKPWWSAGSSLTSGCSPVMSWLPEMTSVQLWCPVPISLPPPANAGTAPSLVLWRLGGTTPGWHHCVYFSFLARSGVWPGMEESLREMLHEPESVRVAVPKRACSGPSFYRQSCCGVVMGGLSWKHALAWIICSACTWGCHAGFAWGWESRVVYLSISCSRNLAWR